jgi:hypothetical protein
MITGCAAPVLAAPTACAMRQAIAGRGSTVAREKPLGRRGRVRADHIKVGMETAVGDDDGWGIEFGGGFGLVRLNLDVSGRMTE